VRAEVEGAWYTDCVFLGSGMDDNRPRPHPQRVEVPVSVFSPKRADLVRYFAWGYLSRRELNERLRQLNPFAP
jgi:hypothetical protein